jgi:hypothetical protein
MLKNQLITVAQKNPAEFLPGLTGELDIPDFP